MNLLGKIFVVLIFVMSLMFMALSLMVFQAHTNWKEEITRPTGAQGQPGWKVRYEQLVTQNQKLATEYQSLQREVVAEKTARAEALAKLQTELTSRQQQLNNANQELAKKTEALAEATATLKTQEQNVNIATGQVQKLTDDLKGQIALADDLFKKSLDLVNRLNQANVKMPELEQRNQQLAQMLGNARLLLTRMGMTLEDPIDRRPPPLDANVEQVNARTGDVEIAAGSHDGIRVGHELDVVRNGRLVGKIKITNVSPDRAVGRTMPGTLYQISRGDTATTRLSQNVSYVAPNTQ